mmetsp:Transcript_24537/g.70451  ORF Transcript_24537/g.70451 Transcript_24537/m.70451 type:complete len:237 (-) Transcript_24537:54-764(-)
MTAEIGLHDLEDPVHMPCLEVAAAFDQGRCCSLVGRLDRGHIEEAIQRPLRGAMHEEPPAGALYHKGLRAWLAHDDGEQVDMASREQALQHLQQRLHAPKLRAGVHASNEEHLRRGVFVEPTYPALVLRSPVLHRQIFVPNAVVGATICLAACVLAAFKVFYGPEVHKVNEAALQKMDYALDGSSIPIKGVGCGPQFQVVQRRGDRAVRPQRHTRHRRLQRTVHLPIVIWSRHACN